MKLQANTSSFHTVFMQFLAILVFRAMEPSWSVNGCEPLLKIEQEPQVHAGSFCLAGQSQLSLGAYTLTTRVETMKAHFQEAARKCIEGATAPSSFRAADQKITHRGKINDADLDFVVCALILWNLLGAFSS